MKVQARCAAVVTFMAVGMAHAEDAAPTTAQAPSSSAAALHAAATPSPTQPPLAPRARRDAATSSLYVAGLWTTAIGVTMEVVGLGLEFWSLLKGAQFSILGGDSSWCSSCEDHTGEMVATGLLIASVVAVVAGTQMIRVGKDQKRSVQLTAGLSPTGGSVRLTF